MQAKIKVAQQRLSVLELAQKLGNVSDACRWQGMTCMQFFEYKKRFEMQSLEGLKDLSLFTKRIHKPCRRYRGQGGGIEHGASYKRIQLHHAFT